MKKYFLKVFGCQMNESDSQRIASFLENQRYKSIKGADSSDEALAKADLIVVVACSVRQSAIDRIFGLHRKFKHLKLQNPNLKLILTGCIIKADKPKFEKFFDAVLNIKDFFTYHLFSDRTKDDIDYLELKAKHSNLKLAYVPIMTGCDNFCSYCVVPYTRGKEISRPIQEIVKEFKDFVKQEYKEIILLGQNVNSYKYGFSNLLKKLNALPGNFRIKFLTNHPKDMNDELIDTITECNKIAKEIHLPIQSGDDEILRKMNRGYTIKQYLNLIEKIKRKIPDVKITTDVIVGFPGETKKQFENTIKLFKKVGFSLAYVNKYSTRRGTPAGHFKDDVPLEEKKRRWKILDDMVNQSKKPQPQAGSSRAEKIIVILGPTASGKSSLAVKLAKEFNGEIISADSRQVYKRMDIGTGKIIKKEMQEIPHHCLDITSPKKQFIITEFKKKALEAIDKIYKNKKNPIICGGTGFYVQAIVDGFVIPKVKPDWKLRKKLEQKTEKELFKQLKKLDPDRAKTIDAKNKRRLIRAIEVILKTGKPIPQIKTNPQYDALYLGVKKPLPELKQKISQRINKMIKAGLEKEVKNLVKKYGWTKVLKNTIGYSSFAEASKDKREIINDIKLQTYQFAKRQLTWFKKYPGNKIHWISNEKEAGNLIKKFLNT